MVLARPRVTPRSGRAPARRLPAVLALALVAGSLGTLVGAGPVAAGDEDESSPASEREVAALTNQSRASAGLPILVPDDALAAFARERSRDMAERDYFSHEIPPTGELVFDSIAAAGYCFVVAGENIGWLGGDDARAEARIHQMFLDSPTHRSVLMGEAWDAVGVGAFKLADGRKFWTVLFADRCDAPGEGQAAASNGPPSGAPKPVLAPPGMRVEDAPAPGFLDSLIVDITGSFFGS